MLCYAAGTREFDMEGAATPGRKRFLVCSIFTVLMAVALIVFANYVQPESKLIDAKDFMESVWLVGGIALAMTIIELFLVKCPKTKEEKELQKQNKKNVEGASDDKYVDDVDMSAYISENYNVPGVYINPMYMQGVPYGIIAQQGQPQMQMQPQNYYVQQNKR